MTLLSAFCWQFRVPVGSNYGAKITSILYAIMAILRGAFQPYFGKQSEIMPCSPQEMKGCDLRGFPAGGWNRDRGIGARSGRILSLLHNFIQSQKTEWIFRQEIPVRGMRPDPAPAATEIPIAACPAPAPEAGILLTEPGQNRI